MPTTVPATEYRNNSHKSVSRPDMNSKIIEPSVAMLYNGVDTGIELPSGRGKSIRKT